MYEDFSRPPVSPDPNKLTPQNRQLFSEAHGNLDLKFALERLLAAAIKNEDPEQEQFVIHQMSCLAGLAEAKRWAKKVISEL